MENNRIKKTCPDLYTEQFTKQSNEITNTPLGAVDINNKLVINAVDVARDNLKIYKRTVDAVTEFATISQRPVDKI
jgi:hypothetical protein